MSDSVSQVDYTKKRIRRLINEDYMDYYGTDVHRLDYRPPHITKALEWLKKNE